MRRSPRGAASRCSRRIAASSDRRSAPAKPDQQQGAVAPAAQVVADRGEDLAQHADRGGEFLRRELAALGGVAADAGQRLADHRLGGRHRAAGEIVQIADRGAAQVDGVDRQAALALGGEERHDVGGGRGQAGQRVAGAPGAPGGDPGAVGAPRVGGLGQPGEGVGGGACGRQAAVERRQWGGDGAVEPAAHLDRRRAERRRTHRPERAGGLAGRPPARRVRQIGPIGASSGGGHGCLALLAGFGRGWPVRPRQTARDCYARQGVLSGIRRAGRGVGTR